MIVTAYLSVAIITALVAGGFMGAETYDESMPIPFNVFAMLLFGTFFGVALGAIWPLSLPLAYFLWRIS